MTLAGKTILILGGNGYLGNHFAARLVQEQARVVAVSRYEEVKTGRASSTSTQKTKTSSGSKAPFLNPAPSEITSIELISSCTPLALCLIPQSQRR